SLVTEGAKNTQVPSGKPSGFSSGGESSSIWYAAVKTSGFPRAIARSAALYFNTMVIGTAKVVIGFLALSVISASKMVPLGENCAGPPGTVGRGGATAWPKIRPRSPWKRLLPNEMVP